MWLSRDPIAENGGINLYAYVENDPINYWDPFGLAKACCGLPNGFQGPPQQYDPSTHGCINGKIISRDEKIKVKIIRRPANLPGGQFFSVVFFLNHEMIIGPDGPPVGMGPIGTKGNPGATLPFILTELTDHSGETKTNSIEVEVKRCAFYENTKLGTATGRWIPCWNDCNDVIDRIIRDSGGNPPTRPPPIPVSPYKNGLFYGHAGGARP